MPSRRRQLGSGEEATTTATHDASRDEERDAQDRMGNDALSDPSFWDFLNSRTEDGATTGLQSGEQDEGLTGVLAMAAEQAEQADQVPERVRDRAEDVEDKVVLAAGAEYSVTSEDMAASDPWRKMARDHGMSPDHLVPFNQHIPSVNVGVASDAQVATTTELAEGVKIYIPSAAEILLAQCRTRSASYEEAVELYGTIAEGPNVKVLTTARERASGDVGQGYGTKGIEGGRFLTQNPTIAGASKKRSVMVDGAREYKVMWVKEFWKCSLYMHDVVWSAGYKPSQSANNHYALAGRLQEQPEYDEIDVKNARPGDAWQRFGGKRSNESHNAILSSFVDVEQGDLHDNWTFSIIGAETERAAEGERRHTMKKGTNENTAGKKIRFFRPKFQR